MSPLCCRGRALAKSQWFDPWNLKTVAYPDENSWTQSKLIELSSDGQVVRADVTHRSKITKKVHKPP